MKIKMLRNRAIHKEKFTTLRETGFIVNGKTQTWEWLEKFDIVYVLPTTKDFLIPSALPV